MSRKDDVAKKQGRNDLKKSMDSVAATVARVQRELDLFKDGFLLRGKKQGEKNMAVGERFRAYGQHVAHINAWLSLPWYKRLFRRFKPLDKIADS